MPSLPEDHTHVAPLDDETLRRVGRVGLALTGARSRADVTEVLLREAVPATDAYAGAMIEVIDDRTSYTVGTVGYDDTFGTTWSRFPADRSYAARHAIVTGEAVFATLDDMRRDFPDMVTHLQPRTRAVAALPLRTSGRVTACLVLSFAREGAVTARKERAALLAVARAGEVSLARADEHDEQARALARVTLLAEAGSALAGSLDVAETLDRITALSIRRVGDWAAVYLPGEDGRLSAFAVAHAEPAKAELLRWYLAQAPLRPLDDPVPGSPQWVFATGRPLLMPIVPPEVMDVLPPGERREAFRAMGLHSVINVPLTSQGRRLGVLGLATTHPSRTYGEADLELAHALAERAALALDHAQLHEAARRSEARYRSLVDATRQTVWTNSPDGRLLGDQPGWARLTGQERAEYEGYGWAEAIHPGDRAATLAAWQDAVAARSTYDVTHRVRVANGAYRHFHARGVPVVADDGTIREWVGVHTDVSEQVEAQRALRAFNAELEARVTERTHALEAVNTKLDRVSTFNRLLLDSAGEGIFGVDMAGLTTFANPAALRMIGYEHDEIVGRPQHALVHHTRPDGTPFPASACPIYSSRLDGQVRHVDDEVFWRRDGTSFPVEYVSTPLRGADGHIEGAVVMFRDVTQRREAEAELRRANAELRRSNAELERFAFVASHDLQEPLRTIASFSELIDQRYRDTLDERGRTYLRLVTQGAVRLKRLVDDLLVFSRLDAQREPLAPVDLSAVAGEALSRLVAAVEETRADVRVADLPVVLGDAPELVQVMQNLVGNALKFRREGVPPEVSVIATREGDWWHVRVTDNGIGVEPEFRERVFGLFQRLHHRERYEGTGLGLAIVRKIVQRHGGDVWLGEAPGGGTTVHLTLRAAPGT
ncbi:PAS domain S-box protein [Deinococcus pimensis]|uniref:PAS domain S-box protein n=1 Tax=Deinococcus pimensis TaxID=309888 RepID=UPI0004B1C13A|nr:PAS domain S-box protein [Deinococcus pimensis]